MEGCSSCLTGAGLKLTTAFLKSSSAYKLSAGLVAQGDSGIGVLSDRARCFAFFSRMSFSYILVARLSSFVARLSSLSSLSSFLAL